MSEAAVEIVEVAVKLILKLRLLLSTMKISVLLPLFISHPCQKD